MTENRERLAVESNYGQAAGARILYELTTDNLVIGDWRGAATE